jgi:hypothetical protein
LHIGRIDGPISDRLGCRDETELLEHGWHPFLHKNDWPTIQNMARALAEARAAHYRIRAVSRSGDRLHLALRTYVMRSAGRVSLGGVIDLEDADAVRCYFDLGA